jgi:hypothetical protein
MSGLFCCTTHMGSTVQHKTIFPWKHMNLQRLECSNGGYWQDQLWIQWILPLHHEWHYAPIECNRRCPLHCQVLPGSCMLDLPQVMLSITQCNSRLFWCTMTQVGRWWSFLTQSAAVMKITWVFSLCSIKPQGGGHSLNKALETRG